MKRIAVCFLATGLTIMGCESKKPEPANGPSPTGSAVPAAQPKAKSGVQPGAQPAARPASNAKAQTVGWTKPEKWKEEAVQSQFRMATFKIPAAEGDDTDGEVSVSRAMGSVDANVNRWRGQFEGSPEAKVEEKDFAGIKTTVVEIEGTWTAGGGRPMAPGPKGEAKKDWMMVVAMVHTQGQAHFFKMWGPKKTLTAGRADFDALLASITQK